MRSGILEGRDRRRVGVRRAYALIATAVLSATMLPLAGPVPASAAWVDSVVSIDRPIGESSTPTSIFYADAPIVDLGAQNGSPTGPNALSLGVFSPDPSLVGILTLTTGGPLAIGLYQADLDPAHNADMNVPHLSWSPGCLGSLVVAWFNILDIGWSGTALTKIAVDIQCGLAGDTATTIQLRWHSHLPIAALDQQPDAATAPETRIGSSSAVQPVTVKNIGDVPVTLGPASVHDFLPCCTPAHDDFTITHDGCADVILGPGDTCAVQVRFRPRDDRVLERYAVIRIPNSTIGGSRDALVYGRAVRVPALSIFGDPLSVFAYESAPITALFDTGPLGGCGQVQLQWYVDGEPFDTIMYPGTLTQPTLGRHTIQARYTGIGFTVPPYGAPVDCAPAQSNVITQDVKVRPTISWSVFEVAGEPGVFRIQVAATSGGLFGLLRPDGATLTVTDETSGTVLGTTTEDTVGILIPRYEVVGRHVLRATAVSANPDVVPAESTTVINGSADLVSPLATAPLASAMSGVVASQAGIPTIVRWSGSDAGSGVTGYELQQSVDLGPWTLVANGPATSKEVAVGFGHDYRFRVRAIDGSRNAGPWAEAQAFHVAAYADQSSRLTYVDTWHTSRATGYQGGRERYATGAGARATLSFTGRSIEWVSAVGPSRGTARVYVDGKVVATINLHASIAGVRRVVWAKSWTTPGSHTVSIRVTGTPGHPRTDLDTLVVLD